MGQQLLKDFSAWSISLYCTELEGFMVSRKFFSILFMHSSPCQVLHRSSPFRRTVFELSTPVGTTHTIGHGFDVSTLRGPWLRDMSLRRKRLRGSSGSQPLRGCKRAVSRKRAACKARASHPPAYNVNPEKTSRPLSVPSGIWPLSWSCRVAAAPVQQVQKVLAKASKP